MQKVVQEASWAPGSFQGGWIRPVRNLQAQISHSRSSLSGKNGAAFEFLLSSIGAAHRKLDLVVDAVLGPEKKQQG